MLGQFEMSQIPHKSLAAVSQKNKTLEQSSE